MTKKTEIKLYKFKFQDLFPHLLEFKSYLSPEDLILVQKKINVDLQTKQILSRGCLRKVLGQVLQVSASDLQIQFTPQGKPFLKDYTNCFFNVSHSNEILVIGISDQEIGIDLEYKNPHFTENLIQTFMGLEEQQLFSTFTNSSQKVDFFYNIWTAKEAISKCFGLGLKMNFSNLVVKFDTITQFSCNHYSVFGKFIDIEPDYTLAVCQKDPLLNYEIIS